MTLDLGAEVAAEPPARWIGPSGVFLLHRPEVAGPLGRRMAVVQGRGQEPRIVKSQRPVPEVEGIPVGVRDGLV